MSLSASHQKEGAFAPSDLSTGNVPTSPVLGLKRIAMAQAPTVFGVILLFALWYIIAILTPPAVLPLPHRVLGRLISWSWNSPQLASYGLRHTGLIPNMLQTMQTVFIAQAAGLVIGSFLGLFSARSPLFRAALNPIALIMTTLPILVLAPFFLVWFGVGRVGSMALVMVYSTTLFVIYSQRGAENLSPHYEQYARTLGAGRFRILRDVLVPGAIPEIMGAFRISVAGAWGLVAISELLGGRAGIGVVIRVLLGPYDIIGILAAIVTVSTVALIFDGLLAWAGRTFIVWRNA
jgi:ABC-type nitrate/sulfonate/bicarbonate transport system permease component